MALRLPSANHFAARRSLRAATGYYTRWIDRSKAFVLGEKPGLLKHLGSVDKRVWKQYQIHLRRATPLERAEFYAREMKERRAKSHQALSLLLGEPRNRVGRSIKLLALGRSAESPWVCSREQDHPCWVKNVPSARPLLASLALGAGRAEGNVW